MPEMEVEVEFEVLCGRCGAGLCGNTRTSYNRRIPQVMVEPCKDCIDAAVKSAEAKECDRGYEQGYKDRLCA